MADFDRIHDQLSLYDISHASPMGDDSDRYAFNVIAQDNWEQYCKSHKPPEQCGYCLHCVMGKCIFTFKRKSHYDFCDIGKYEWNEEPEDEEDRYRRTEKEVMI